MGNKALELLGITKVYSMGDNQVHALRGITLEVREGEMVSIMGPSGCGKSTLLQIIGCLDKPTSGLVRIGGTEASSLSDDQLAKIRNKHIGFIFQSFNLLPHENAINNVMVPLQYGGVSRKQGEAAARQALAAVGLEARVHHKPNELSGGQRQRVAIARAIVNQPSVVLADEPTGALDQSSGKEVMGILQRLNAEGKTIVVVTHDAKVAQYSQRILELCDGSVLRDELVRRNEVDIRPAELDAGAPPPPPGQQVCFRCNAGNRPQARYCANCGASLALRPQVTDTIMRRLAGLQVLCPYCNASNRPFARYCVSCGGSMDPAAAP